MPECIYVNHEVQMDATERKLYDQLKHDLIIPLEDGDIDAANAASLSNKLLQMANGAVYDENKETRTIHSRKLEMLEDLIEAANGQPVLIGYWFKHDNCEGVSTLMDSDFRNADCVNCPRKPADTAALQRRLGCSQTCHNNRRNECTFL